MQVLIIPDRNIHTNAVQERRIENDLANTLEKCERDLTRVGCTSATSPAGAGPPFDSLGRGQNAPRIGQTID